MTSSPSAAATLPAVRVIAHRGASADEPESTNLAVERAIADGADAVEIDVQRSADGALVISHDCTLDRTTDAITVYGREGLRACDLTLAELRRLDVSGWFDPERHGQRILTLAEAVQLVGQRARLLVEVSPCEAYAGTDLAGDVARELSRLVPDLDGIAVQSFRPDDCRRLREVLPDAEVGWLVSDGDRSARLLGDEEWVAELAQVVDQLNPHQAMAGPAEIERWHRLGLTVNLWVVNEPDEIARAVAAGADGLITDHPDRVRL